ncbi:MAG: hypothetical protein ABFD51_01630 [Anaerolineaceae bacterium]
MTNRPYYSIRSGKKQFAKYDLPILRRLFKDIFIIFLDKYYFQQAFGYYCVDRGEVPGTLGTDIDAQIYRRLRKENLYPIQDKCESYSEDDLFDIIEFLYDNVSKPIEGTGWYHNFSNCGMHDQDFDIKIGRYEYRQEINNLLGDYLAGFELSIEGEIYPLASDGLQDLFDIELPVIDPENINNKVTNAVRKYRNRHATNDEKKDAIRDLADVLEYLREEIRKLIIKGYLLNKDESDLFNLANNFGLRHHNENQKTGYDKDIWFPWLFFYYLSTIQAIIAMVKKAEEKPLNV